MAQRDYVSRAKNSRKKKKTTHKGLLVLLGAVVILAFGAGLLLLKQKSPEVALPTPTVETQPKSVLPSRPEEVWSYIQELETREIPIDNSPSAIEKNAQLTEEQKKILALLEQDQQNAQKAKSAEGENTASLAKPTPPAKESKENSPKVVDARPDSQQKASANTAKPEAVAPTSVARKGFGLQCGAFKNKQQAENLQARLAMAGFNSHVSSSADWNRVFIGPLGDRSAANEAQAKAKSIANCVVINM